MTAQRKRIRHGQLSFNDTESAHTIVSQSFDDIASGNLHGLNISMGVSPFGPEETFVGRWYVVLMPHSVNSDATIRNAWIAHLDTIAEANIALATTEFVWGAGSILCSDMSTWLANFNPMTSRNIKKGDALRVIIVADAISGVIDDWDVVATMSLFTS